MRFEKCSLSERTCVIDEPRTAIQCPAFRGVQTRSETLLSWSLSHASWKPDSMPVGLYMSKSTTRSIGTFSGRIRMDAEAVSSECMVLSPSSASMKKLSIDTEGASRLRRDGLAQLLAEQEIGRAACRDRVCQYV